MFLNWYRIVNQLLNFLVTGHCKKFLFVFLDQYSKFSSSVFLFHGFSSIEIKSNSRCPLIINHCPILNYMISFKLIGWL